MRWAFFVLLAGAGWMLRHLTEPGVLDPAAAALLALGALVVGGELAGTLVARARLPRITGYLLIGMLLGPSLFRVAATADLHELRLFEELALGLIALTAGGEFRVAALARDWRLLASVTVSHAVLLLAGVTGVMWLVLQRVPLLGPLGPREVLAGAALLGVIAVAKSPATTIAVITESRARGPLVDAVLGVTIVKDLVIILLFTWVEGLARSWVGGTALDLAVIRALLGQVLLSLAVGVVLGVALGVYLTRVRRHPELVVLGLVLVAAELARGAGMEPLLLCMAAGFAARNLFPRAAEPFLAALERSSPPVYVVFFALVGAGLDLAVFSRVWRAALLVAGLRLVLVWLLTGAAAAAAGGAPVVRRWAWMGFVAQAGFSLGLAARVARGFPGLGPALAAVVVGGVILNQLLGPVLWRHALVAAGEASAGDEEGAEAAAPAPS